jgi:hypothetical protein
MVNERAYRMVCCQYKASCSRFPLLLGRGFRRGRPGWRGSSYRITSEQSRLKTHPFETGELGEPGRVLHAHHGWMVGFVEHPVELLAHERLDDFLGQLVSQFRRRLQRAPEAADGGHRGQKGDPAGCDEADGCRFPNPPRELPRVEINRGGSHEKSEESRGTGTYDRRKQILSKLKSLTETQRVSP